VISVSFVGASRQLSVAVTLRPDQVTPIAAARAIATLGAGRIPDQAGVTGARTRRRT
jgi:hypothetical protein